jgi:hypothetical protein
LVPFPFLAFDTILTAPPTILTGIISTLPTGLMISFLIGLKGVHPDFFFSIVISAEWISLVWLPEPASSVRTIEWWIGLSGLPIRSWSSCSERTLSLPSFSILANLSMAIDLAFSRKMCSAPNLPSKSSPSSRPAPDISDEASLSWGFRTVGTSEGTNSSWSS